VTERGTHDELMKLGGDYSKLVQRQLEPSEGGKSRNGSVVSLSRLAAST